MSESDNARRTILKADEVLRQCQRYFANQASMNATAHMSERVMYPPIHAAISSVLQGIRDFGRTYPLQAKCKHCSLEITSDSGGSDWVHAEGPQKQLHRCALEPYGYDAAPEGEPCQEGCIALRTEAVG